MKKPDYANQISITANHDSREAVFLFATSVPTFDESLQFSATETELHEVASVVVTENTLKSLHDAIGTILTQLDRSSQNEQLT